MDIVHESPELFVGRSALTSWAFTLRKTSTKKVQPTQADYHYHINNLCLATKSHITDSVFERTGGLHMHGTIEVPNKVQMYKFRVRGWRLHLEQLWDRVGWQSYMAKEQVLKDYEDELSEQEHPVHRLRRSLFKTAIPLQLTSPNGVSASLPDNNHQDSNKVKLCERGNAEGV